MQPPTPDSELDRALRESEALAAENLRLQLELRETTAKYAEVRASLSWQMTAPLRVALDWVTAARQRLGLGGPTLKDPVELTDANYRRWVAQFDHLTEADRKAIREAIGKLERRPVFSLLLTVRDPADTELQRTLKSIRQQLYKDWEAIVIDDASTAPHVARTLANSGDSRVRIQRREVRGGAAAAGNEALALAKGEFVAWIEAGDVLAETALFELAAVIDQNPGVAVVYSDEDELDDKGERVNPKFKTGWNPDLLLAQDYLGQLTVYRRELVTRMGGLRAEFDSLYDLALRATADAAAEVRHVAVVLCHRGSRSGLGESAVKAVQRFLGDRATVEAAGSRGRRVRWRAADVKVTVIIPTRDRADLLERCVEGLLNRTKYPSLEVVIVDNQSREERTRQLFAKYSSIENVQVLEYPGEFNWSAMNNAGAKAATGGILLFLNNDTDVMDPDWLGELAAQAARPEVGAIGAKLLFLDKTVQHAGIWLGPGVFLRHLLRLSKRDDPGYLGQLALCRNLSAVTGACMAIRREVFEESGGFDESFPVSYNDLDLCLRLIQKGYRIVWTPHAELFHLESASRGSGEARWRKEEADRDRFRARWQREMDDDPFFNPNLDLIGEEKLALAVPPRRKRPW